MSTRYPTTLSFWEKAVLIYVLLRALGSGVVALILSPFRGKGGAPTVFTHVKLAIGRALFKNMSIAQSQYITPPLESIYPAHAQKKGFVPEFVTMKDGTKAYWVGNSKSKNVLIWFHGGGYTIAADPAHLTFASVLIENAKAAGKDLCVLFLAYTLAPHACYPRQLQQGVEILRYTLDELARSPTNIMIGGDSAGGNLTLGVISHSLHPHPRCPPLPLSAPLKGAILLAPWVSFRTDWPSTKANAQKDIIQPSVGDLWSANFLGTSSKDEYNEPGERTDEQWWAGLQDVVAEIFIVGGQDEILVDSIREMEKKLKAAHSKTTLLIAHNEFHDQPMLSIGTPGKGQQADAIKNWITSRL